MSSHRNYLSRYSHLSDEQFQALLTQKIGLSGMADDLKKECQLRGMDPAMVKKAESSPPATPGHSPSASTADSSSDKRTGYSSYTSASHDYGKSDSGGAYDARKRTTDEQPGRTEPLPAPAMEPSEEPQEEPLEESLEEPRTETTPVHEPTEKKEPFQLLDFAFKHVRLTIFLILMVLFIGQQFIQALASLDPDTLKRVKVVGSFVVAFFAFIWIMRRRNRQR